MIGKSPFAGWMIFGLAAHFPFVSLSSPAETAFRFLVVLKFPFYRCEIGNERREEGKMEVSRLEAAITGAIPTQLHGAASPVPF